MAPYRLDLPGSFSALSPAVQNVFRGALASMAALAAHTQPVNPLWEKLAGVERATMKFDLAGYRIVYQVDICRRALSVLDVYLCDEAKAECRRRRAKSRVDYGLGEEDGWRIAS